MKTQLLLSLLSVLQACDGLPMPESTLLTAVRLHSRPRQPSQADTLDALHELETKGYAEAFTDDLTEERTWTLTNKGAHKARQAR
jgi:predicted deacetylase